MRYPAAAMYPLRPSLGLAFRLGLGLGLLVLGPIAAAPLAPVPKIGAIETAVLQRWLEQTTQLQTWHAEVVQTRYLKALTQPLTSQGQVWFAAPDRFRWELGHPPQSLVLREGNELQILSPRLKRAERFSLSKTTPGPMQDALALLDTGFPRNAAEFQERFQLVAVLTNQPSTNGSFHAFRLQPHAASARRFLPELRVEVTTADFQLVATELLFADGSRLRNDFSAPQLNLNLEPTLFRTNLDASWKISTPTAP